MLWFLAIGVLVAMALFWTLFGPLGALIPLILGAMIASGTDRRRDREALAAAIKAPPAPPAPAREDVAARIGELADLRDRGAITAEEYEAKKAELLARL